MMSDIIEKTIASLPGLIAGATGLGGEKPISASRAFQSFVNSLGAIHSKYDEEQFIKKELSVQKQRLAQPNLSPGQIRESLVRLVYCHILGYDVSFAYIHAVKLAQQGTLLGKRAGYLVSSLFLRDDNELVMLLVNTIQKDLKSTNMLTVCMALTAASQLITTEMIPALLPLVEERLKHPKEIVRKKAVLCMHSFHCKAPDLLRHAHHHFKAALCDKDPGVMWASLHVFHDLVQREPSVHKDLIRNLVEVEFQVLNRKLPMEYEFHNVPAPWLQIQILKILNKLGAGDPQSSEVMYPVLKDALQRTDPSHKIGLAVIYECLETILSIWPQPAMVEHAANCVAKFLSSKNINLRYLGLKALSHVVKINSGYALEHQDVVIDCLEHPDPTIQRKTLELLYSMANPDNLQVICSHMLAHLHKDSADEYLKTDIISKVTHLTQKFGRDKKWHIDTVFKVLSLAGDDSPKGVLNNTAKIIIDGCEDEISTHELRMYVVQLSWKVLKQKSWPNIIIQLVTWILGEYSHIQEEVKPQEIIRELQAACMIPKITNSAITWILSAMIKISLRNPTVAADVEIGKMRQKIRSENMESVQRLNELERFQKDSCGESLEPSTCDEILRNADFTLSFLDDFVADELEKGSYPYKHESIRNPQPVISREKQSIFAGLNFNPYEEPSYRSGPPSLELGSGSNTGSAASDGTREKPGGLQLKVGKKVWGKEGIIQTDAKELKIKQDDSPQKSNDDLENEALASSTSLADFDGRSERRKELASALFSGLKSPTQSTLLTSSDVVLGAESPASSSGVSSAKSASSNPTSSKTTDNAETPSAERPGHLAGTAEGCGVQLEGLLSPSNPTTELLTAESLMSPSEGHWVSLHRNLTSPEERELTDYIGIVDSEGNHSLHTEEVLNSGMDHREDEQYDRPRDGGIHDSDDELHEADSLEDLGVNIRENLVITEEDNSTHEIKPDESIIPKDFQQYPCERTHTLVSNTERLKISYQKVWAPESLVVAVRCEALDVDGDSLSIKPCPVIEDDFPPIEVSDVSKDGITTLHIYKPTDSLILQLLASDTEVSRFTITVSDIDFLRPCAADVAEFTKLWKELAQGEQTTSKSVGKADAEEFVKLLGLMLHVHTVNSTGNETLVAGKLLNTSNCAMGHLLLNDSSINIRFRSSSQRLLHQIISFIDDLSV